MPRLLIAASGTGGHLFPALSVAEALPDSWKIVWLGVPDRLETEILPKKYPLVTVKAGGLRAKGLRKLFQLAQLLSAAFKVRDLHRKESIDVVFTTGGYIAAPAILGAVSCGIPVLLHESNAMPGKVTRLMGRFCNFVALGLPASVRYLSGCRTLVTGTPVRASFLQPQSLPSWVPLDKGPLIVVMGGSQGALGLNRMVRHIVPCLLEVGCRIVHLTGQNDRDIETISHRNYIAKPFSDEIPALLQHADLAISRAGAGALSELAVCNTPAILIPYPQATDCHQDLNAACAAELGAAVIVHQHQPDQNNLRETVLRLLKSRLLTPDSGLDALIKMREGMNKFAGQGSERVLVKILQGFI